MLSTQTLKSIYSLIFYVIVVIHLNSTYIFKKGFFLNTTTMPSLDLKNNIFLIFSNTVNAHISLTAVHIFP